MRRRIYKKSQEIVNGITNYDTMNDVEVVSDVPPWALFFFFGGRGKERLGQVRTICSAHDLSPSPLFLLSVKQNLPPPTPPPPKKEESPKEGENLWKGRKEVVKVITV